MFWCDGKHWHSGSWVISVVREVPFPTNQGFHKYIQYEQFIQQTWICQVFTVSQFCHHFVQFLFAVVDYIVCSF